MLYLTAKEREMAGLGTGKEKRESEQPLTDSLPQAVAPQ